MISLPFYSSINYDNIDFDYEEMDEIDLFKKWDKKIWDDYIEAKRAFFSEQEEDAEEEEEEEEFDEDGKKIEFNDGFDKEGFISDYLEKHPGINENRVRYVMTLGIYGGQRNEFNHRHGKGHSIYANEDIFIGEYQDEEKNGFGIYIYKSAMRKKRERGLHAVDVKVDKLAKEDEHIANLVKQEKYMEAAREICKNDNSLNILRVFYVLQYGSYPFYAGQFKENLKQGKGVTKNKDGSIYIGNWANNKRHGQGTFYYPNGDIYDGQWKDGFKHGQGTYHFADKNCILEGTWNNGQMDIGYWKMCDGNFYYGKFEENRPEGDGEMWFTDKSQRHIEAKLTGRIRAGEWISSPDFLFN